MSNIIKNLLLVCISIFMLLFVFEIFLRFIPFVGSASYTQPVDKTSPIPHLKPNHKYVNAWGWNGKIAIEHVTNSYGFQTPVEFYEDQVANCIFGDSYVVASQVKAEDSFHGILTNSGFTVYPFGKSTLALADYIVLVKWALNNFNCKKIIFNIEINDFFLSSMYYYFDFTNNGKITLIPFTAPLIKEILRRSALANYLVRNLRFGGIKNLITLKRSSFMDFGKTEDLVNVDKDKMKRSYLTIDYFFEELKELNISYQNILFILDGDRLRIYDGGEYQKSYHWHISEYFMEKSKDNKIKLINLQPVFESDFSKNKKEFNYPFDYHWNEYGHYIVANQIEKSNFLILH